MTTFADTSTDAARVDLLTKLLPNLPPEALRALADGAYQWRAVDAEVIVSIQNVPPACTPTFDIDNVSTETYHVHFHESATREWAKAFVLDTIRAHTFRAVVDIVFETDGHPVVRLRVACKHDSALTRILCSDPSVVELVHVATTEVHPYCPSL